MLSIYSLHKTTSPPINVKELYLGTLSVTLGHNSPNPMGPEYNRALLLALAPCMTVLKEVFPVTTNTICLRCSFKHPVNAYKALRSITTQRRLCMCMRDYIVPS